MPLAAAKWSLARGLVGVDIDALAPYFAGRTNIVAHAAPWAIGGLSEPPADDLDRVGSLGVVYRKIRI
jgi:hypothetical protein